MPDEPRNTHGRTLREQVRAAAAATAEQQRARKQEKGGSGKDPKKGTSKRTVTKRTASKDQQQKEKARDKSAKETEKRSFIETVRDNFLNMGLGLRVLFGVIALLIVAAAVLYPMGCTYYQALRQEQTLQAELDAVNQRNEKIGKKIREATLEKVPYMLVVGDRDMENATVSPRTRTGEDLGAMSLADFAAKLHEIVDSKARQ